MSNSNDVNFLLGDRLQEFDSEYRQRQVDYTVPQHISEFESASDKWVRQNMRRNNPVYVGIGESDSEARYTRDASGSSVNKLQDNQKSIFTEMNETDLNKGQEDTRTLDYRLGEINNGLIRNSLSEQEINKQIDLYNERTNPHSSPYHNAIYKIGANELLKGIQEITPVSNIFFSDLNINTIDKAIRSNIKKYTHNSITKQINNSLFIIMRSIYLQYSKNISSNDTLAEIKYLNKLVINECVEKITSELIAYNRYEKDINNLVIPLDNPSDTSSDWRNYTYSFTELI